MADRDVTVDILANDKTAKGVKSAADRFEKLDGGAKKLAEGLEKTLVAFGAKAGGSLVTSLMKPLAGLSGSLTPVLAGAAVAAAPLIAGAISGAVIGGVGLGGVAGGLLIASKDARVQAAADGFSKRIGARLEKAGGMFVQPALDGLDRIEAAVDTIDLDKVFRDASRFVKPLADGVGRAIEEIGDGIESLMANAGPVIDDIATGIGDIGEALGEGLESLSDNADTSGRALAVLFAVISSSISGFFMFVNGVMEITEALESFTEKAGKAIPWVGWLTDALPDIGKGGDVAAAGTDDAAGGIQKVGDEAEQAAPDVRTFEEKMRDAADAAGDLFDSTTDVAGALDKAREAAKENGKTLDENTEKGRDNRDALSSVARELRDNYDAYVAVNGAGGEASRVAEDNRAAFVKSARQFGLTAEKAEELADKILGIPRAVSTKPSLADQQARKAINSYIAMLRKIPAYKRTVVETVRIITGNGGSDSGLQSGIDKQNRTGVRAQGGPVNMGGRYLVGENGPEILEMGNQQGNIVPNGGGSSLDGVTLLVDLGEGVRTVVQAQIVRHDRQLKQRAMAGAR